MTAIHRICNARLRGETALFDIHIDPSGLFSCIEEAKQTPLCEGEIDAGGNLVLPPFIDSHLHLDLVYSLEMVSPNKSGTLVEAISHWEEAKRTMKPEDVCHRAIRAIREAVSFGTGFMRSHVDIGTSAGLRLLEGVLAAREQTKEIVDIQLVAFPQDGLIQDPGALDLMKDAMKLGCDVVGGIPHNERTADDGKEHLRQVFELAERYQCLLDCHIDETDDPGSRNTEYMAAMAIDRGWQGRITGSHVCALSSYDDVHAAKVISLLSKGGVNVVSNPGVNLHLQGRFDRYPKRRGLTRVSELLSAGVNVSIGQDCIHDPFYPFGTGNMQEVALLLAHAEHLSSDDELELVLDSITDSAARTLGLEAGQYGIEPGRAANCVVLQTSTVCESIRTHRPPSCVVRRGQRLLK